MESLLFITPIDCIGEVFALMLKDYYIKSIDGKNMSQTAKEILSGKFDYVFITGKVNLGSPVFDGYHLFKALVKMKLENNKNVPKPVLLLSNSVPREIIFYPFIVPIKALREFDNLLNNLKKAKVSEELYEHTNKMQSILPIFAVLPYHR